MDQQVGASDAKVYVYPPRVTWTPRRIIELRASHGWIQQELADHIDVSRRAVQWWESGDLDEPSKMSRSNEAALDRIAASTRPPITVAELVANIHRIPVKALFTESVRRLMNGIPDGNDADPDVPELSDVVMETGPLDLDPDYLQQGESGTSGDETGTL